MKYVVGIRYIPDAPLQTIEVEGNILDYIEKKYLFLASRHPDGTLKEFEFTNHLGEPAFFWFKDEKAARSNEFVDQYKYVGQV